jgi:hypothetical protein
MTTTRQLYRKAMNWWSDLPWYWKVIGCIPLVFILLLGFISLFTRKEPETLPPKLPPPPITDLKDLWQKEKELQLEIEARQKVIAKLIDEAEGTNAEAIKKLHELAQTKTMEELDALQKEWDL